jgi:hypothetical protein
MHVQHDCRTSVHPADARYPAPSTRPCWARRLPGLPVLSLLLALWACPPSGGGVAAAQALPTHVRLVTKPLAPLVIQQGAILTGFSIEI